MRRSGEASPEASVGSGDPELERLLGTIGRRRLAQVARERSIGVPPGAVRSAVVRSAVVRSAVVRSAASAFGEVRDPRPGKPTEPPKASESAEGGVVLDVKAVGGSVYVLRVARPRGFSYAAGQSVKLSFAGAPVRRRYSIASSPRDAHLEFCIERVPEGRLTSYLPDLAPGDRVTLAPAAKGSLSLQPGKTQHVMIATVTGIAPLRSLLRDALGATRSSGQNFSILHGASYADELPYAAELSELASSQPGVQYLPTVSRPGAPENRGRAGRQGRVETHVIATLQPLGPASEVGVYACGHPEMVRNVQRLLAPLGYEVSVEAFD